MSGSLFCNFKNLKFYIHSLSKITIKVFSSHKGRKSGIFTENYKLLSRFWWYRKLPAIQMNVCPLLYFDEKCYVFQIMFFCWKDFNHMDLMFLASIWLIVYREVIKRNYRAFWIDCYFSKMSVHYFIADDCFILWYCVGDEDIVNIFIQHLLYNFLYLHTVRFR